MPPAGLLDELLASYSEAHRAYHTVLHLEECFAALEPARDLAERIHEVELALWFHDAVYDTRARDNEERSAAIADQALLAAGVDREAVSRIRASILATKHTVRAEDADARLVVDADLAILGADERRFDDYERQVRQEYAWVPEPAFREGRGAILRSFLDRASIYGTAFFASRFEAQARRNLERSLAALTT